MAPHICKPRNLLVGYFGEEKGGYALWNYTCFPMDDDVALEQAEKLIARHKEVGDQAFTELDAKIEQEMEDACARYDCED